MHSFRPDWTGRIQPCLDGCPGGAWINVLENDPRETRTAAVDAQRICITDSQSGSRSKGHGISSLFTTTSSRPTVYCQHCQPRLPARTRRNLSASGDPLPRGSRSSATKSFLQQHQPPARHRRSGLRSSSPPPQVRSVEPRARCGPAAPRSRTAARTDVSAGTLLGTPLDVVFRPCLFACTGFAAVRRTNECPVSSGHLPGYALGVHFEGG